MGGTGTRRVVAALALMVSLPAFHASRQVVTTVYLDQTAHRAESTLGLAVSSLSGQLDRYRHLPILLAQQQSVRLLASQPEDPGRISDMNVFLKETAALLDASDIYVMSPDGTTVAASNYDLPTAFIGENFSFRPYFQDAAAGGHGSFYGLGTTSLKRGYYFSAPIETEAGAPWVIALKVDVDALEAAWYASDYEIVVTDPQGIVFMSGRPEWLFMGLHPLTEERLSHTQEIRRYADAELVELPLSLSRTRAGRQIVVMGADPVSYEYLAVAQDMPSAGWTVNVFVDVSQARRQAWVTVAMIWLAFGLTVAGGLLWMQRRARLAERQEHQRDVREKLERRVEARTADLAAVNLRLEREVAERSSTEQQLRRTQADLIQSAKLAALGQMSAELSHEFNQPLAALRSYLDSAQVLIARDRVPEAGRYLGRIGDLAERMTAISRNLSNFARKPGEHMTSVPVDQVVADALEILDWRIRADKVQVDLHLPPLRVRAGRVRLQQVLVNILANALDAMEGEDRRIAIGADVAAEPGTDGDRVRITLRDSGPGVPPGIVPRIFDPFFSTKGVGRGLGLGLSISYNIIKDFGGELTIANTGQGAEVAILLAPGEAP